MKINTIYNEPCLDTLGKMPDNFLDCVITSPPYWQLRDYGYKGQWGLEPTFQEYLNNLWFMMDEIYRVLKPEGTVWINLGDTYNSGGNYRSVGEDQKEDSKSREYQEKSGMTSYDIKLQNIKPKTLLLLPHIFAIGCIERGWIVRNDIIWAKRNGMPESVTDRFSKKHEYFFFLTKSEKYFFDLDSIRDKYDIDSLKRELRGNRETNKYSIGESLPKGVHANTMSKHRAYRGYNDLETLIAEKKGKNPGTVADFWDIPTKQNNTKHYASYNDSLIAKPILAGCPKGGLIYDPFMGSGSTAEAAIRAGRNFIGSEMGTEYCNIANERIHPFLLQTQLF